MRKIVVFTNLTVDGVMQAPGSPDEDPRGGFQYGGWGAAYGAMQSSAAGEALSKTDIGPMLFGRRTYERFYSFWPKQTGSPFTEMLNNAEKYVASTTLKDPLPWQNSILLKGDAGQALAELKVQPGKDFMIMGSGELVQSLMKQNLVDLYVLLIHPLILGLGRHLFPEGGIYATLKLIDAKSTSSGVVVVTYQPAE
ncbi:MAG: dihydrofolate reductase family protein [Anaerolineaceae bacterium]|nr:dihydrofolate reductase family protein [Anaerolineaceae bacterium]